jgi:transposase
MCPLVPNSGYSKTRIPVEQIARSFGISRASVYNWRSRMRQSDSLERSEKRGGRRPKLDEEARQHLRRLLHERCEWTLAELCLELERISGVQVHRATMSRTLLTPPDFGVGEKALKTVG